VNILLISVDNDAYHLACKLADEGERVYFWVKDPRYANVGKGRDNPKVVPYWQSWLDKVDFVIFDMVKMGKEADQIRKQVPVVGAAAIADEIELNREIGQKIMEEAGTDKNFVDISFHKKFSTIADGVKFLKGQKEPFVFKALGNKDHVWTFVGQKGNDGLIQYMESLPNMPFILQKCVNGGVEVSTEGWFNGKDFIYPFNHTMEKKRLMNGDRGQNTGCQGSICWICEDDEIVTNALLPIAKVLEKGGYHGPVDVNCIATEDKLYFLEFTARFGYHAIENLYELIEGDRPDFFYRMAKGNIKEQEFSSDYSMALSLSFPPYPDYEHKEKCRELKGMKVFDIDDMEGVWLHDVMWDKDRDPVIAGADALLGCIVATSPRIADASKKTLKRAQDISLMKEVQFRTDIAEGVEENIKQLKSWGWI